MNESSDTTSDRTSGTHADGDQPVAGATDSTNETEGKLRVEVQVERLSDIESRLSVEVPWDEIKVRLDEAYLELGRGVTIKGFRKGKVPRRMLEQLFGKHVNKEMAQRLVQESFVEALRQHEIRAVSEPELEEPTIVEGESFRYAATIQVVPQLEPKDYFGVDVHVRQARVTEEEVEQALRGKQRELTDFRAVEGRNTEAGDVLLVDVIGKVEGGEPISVEKAFVELGETPLEPLPGLAAALTGIAPDQKELELELELPAPRAGAASAGASGGSEAEGAAAGESMAEEAGTEQPAEMRKARLLVTVHHVRQKIVPELDDDFAKDTGEAQTLDELREKLREKLLERDELQARREAREELMRELVRRNEVPVVPALVERSLEGQVRLQKALMGLDPAAPSEMDKMLRDTLRPDIVEMVRSGLLLDAIGKKEGVEVEDADIEKRLAEIAAARGQNLARVRSEYEKEGRLESLRNQLREDKTLDLLMSKAKTIVEAAPEGASPSTPADQPAVGAEPPAQGDAPG